MNSYFFLLIFLHICKSLVFASSSSCPGFESVVDDIAPRLHFSKFPFKSTLGERDEVLLNTTKIVPISLDCWAPYPIDFTFKGHLTNQRLTVRTHVSKFPTTQGHIGHCYRINVSLYTYKEVTGNYSCFNVHNPQLLSSKYIFIYSPPPNVLLGNGETLKISVENEDNKSLILPCAISNPTFAPHIRLFKVDGNKSELLLLPSPTLKYDPKVGFEMSTTQPALDTLLGNYECRHEAVEVVRIKVVGPPEWIVYPRTKRIDLKLGDHLVLECLSKTEELVLKSSPQLESTSSVENQNYHSQDLLPYFNYKKILVTPPFTEGLVTGSVQCLRKSDGTVLHQWQYKISNETRQEGVLDTRRLMNSCPSPINPKGKSDLSIVLFECDNWVACRMSQCLRNDPTCMPNNHCVKKLCMPNGIIQCPTDGEGTTAQIFFTGFNGVKYINWKYAETKDILRIQLPNKSKERNKGEITLICEGTNFVLAGGFQWTMTFVNDTTTPITDTVGRVRVGETWGESHSIIASSLTFAPKYWALEVRTVVKSLTCSGPVWNSTEWIAQSVHISSIIDMLDEHNGGVPRSTHVHGTLIMLLFVQILPL